MKKIWNGFDTSPHTLPRECVICLGACGGDFVQLPCAHGGPGHNPIHAACLVESFVNLSTDPPQAPRCPVCRVPFGHATLLHLTDYIYSGRLISFPDDHDQPCEEHVYDDEEDKKRLMNLLVRAQQGGHGNALPHETYQNQDMWDDVISGINYKILEIQEKIDQHAYTLEDLEEVQETLKTTESTAAFYAGRAAQLEHDGFSTDRVSFHEIYQKIRQARDCLEALCQRLAREKEEKQHEHETHGTHVH